MSQRTEPDLSQAGVGVLSIVLVATTLVLWSSRRAFADEVTLVTAAVAFVCGLVLADRTVDGKPSPLPTLVFSACSIVGLWRDIAVFDGHLSAVFTVISFFILGTLLIYLVARVRSWVGR